MNWRLLGNLGRIDPANTEIYYDLFDQYPDEFFYEYYIKFEGEMVIDELTEVLAISNDFIFSFLAVPHPSGDSSKYVLHSSWNSSGNTIPEGVKVNLIWTE
ncbi:MAG TPA: hypothetical protein EYN69_07980 [Flavobacteriales bacterium]|nr:hypothetical protein [Flavobacteriales bacterium]